MPNQHQPTPSVSATTVVTAVVGVLQSLAILALAGAIVYVGVTAFPKVERYLDLKARHDCATDYHLEYNDTVKKTTIVRPLDNLYADCLKQTTTH